MKYLERGIEADVIEISSAGVGRGSKDHATAVLKSAGETRGSNENTTAGSKSAGGKPWINENATAVLKSAGGVMRNDSALKPRKQKQRKPTDCSVGWKRWLGISSVGCMCRCFVIDGVRAVV